MSDVLQSVRDTALGLHKSGVIDDRELAESYLIDVLVVLKECYHDFSAYVDPRAIFTIDGLSVLGWSIEDLEEALGFPRGYTDVGFEDGEKNKLRLKALSRHGGDEEMEQYFEKYLSKCS